MSSSRLPAASARDVSAPVRAPSRKSGGARIVGHLPQYDVRVRRELAHRRFVLSLARRMLRLISLHLADAAAVWGGALMAAALTDIAFVPRVAGALVAFTLLGLNLRGSYRPGEARRDALRLLTGVLIGLGLAWLPGTLPGEMPMTSQFLAIFGLGATALLILERRLIDAIVHAAYERGIGLRRALLVARADEAENFLSVLAESGHDKRTAEDQVIVGYVTADRTTAPDALGTIADLEAVVDTEDVGEVLVAASLSRRTLASLAESCFERGVRVLVIPADARPTPSWAEPTQIGPWPAYHLHPARLEVPALLLKRATDLVLSVLTLVLVLPVMLLIAAAIKVESRGPVFFRQRRVGLGGREFMMWKFRSMAHEAESKQTDVAHLNAYSDGRLFKLREDPRVTRVGRLLRRFSLDELPQVINIIAGDMSLVGPRPPLPAEVRHYEPRHFIRLSVVPGLTGPWQVNGRNLITDFEEVVRLEREYIERWSLRTDIEIMFRTIGVVLEGKGAY